MSVIFYGTTTVCEAMVVIIWFVDDSWNICQRVVCLMWLASSLKGEEIARQLISTFSIDLGILSHLVLASMRDKVSVNDVAMTNLV